MTAEPLKCTACGAKLGAEDRFCGECGAPRPSVSGAGPAKPPKPPAGTPPRGRTPKGVWIASLAACVAVVGGIIVLALTQGWFARDGKQPGRGRASTVAPGRTDPRDEPEPDPAQGGIALRNTSRRDGTAANGKPLYRWTVYLDGPAERLRQVRSVRYFLHRTFDPSEVVVADGPKNGFAVTRHGWGTFTIRATVHFRDGTTVNLSHLLRLGSG